jgi:hypothetical protein
MRRNSPKKPYRKPQLLVYGNLTEMTLAAGMMGKMDGLRGRKTGP